MKTKDPLLAAWAETLLRRRDAPAIFDTKRQVLCRFEEIEALSRRYENGPLGDLRPGEILAVQIGNHAHWPALLLACLRREIVVLPLERTVGDQERASASVGRSRMYRSRIFTASNRCRPLSDSTAARLLA